MLIPFGTTSYRHRSLPLSAQRMVNCYLEPAPLGAKTLAAVVQSYGIDDFATPGTGPLRGALRLKGVPYVVSGTKLYRLSSTGSATELGDVPGFNFVDMAGDEINIMLVTDTLGYYWNGTTVAAITDPDFPGADWVENIDGYFVIGEPASGRFFVSANRNPASWDALDFATAERYPDDLVQGVVDHGELILFGSESGEVMYNSGDADFPLARVGSGHFEKGCGAKRSVAKAAGTVCFYGHDRIVYKLDGYTPVPISTPAIEQALEDAVDKDFIGLSWTEAGHTFYGLKCDDGTWVYDFTTQLWYERISYGLSHWLASFALLAYGKTLVGDATSNRVGQLDPDEFTEWGDVLRSSATSPPILNDNRWQFHHRVELVFEQGVGTPTGQGADPQVMLRFSDDGGRTWSNEKWRGLGRIGEFRKRACYNRMGRSRDRVYELAVSDPVRRTLIQALTEIEGGSY